MEFLHSHLLEPDVNGVTWSSVLSLFFCFYFHFFFWYPINYLHMLDQIFPRASEQQENIF